MKKLFCCLIITLLSSCAVVGTYIPNTSNVPMLEEKGEGNISVGTNATTPDAGKFTYFDQFELSSSYAITDKIGLQLNGAYFKPESESKDVKGLQYFGELGVGYFRRISPKFIFETYGLIGYGSVRNEFDQFKTDIERYWFTDPTYKILDGNFNANFLRFGIQPSLTHSRSSLFYSFSSRFVFVNFYNITGDLKKDDEDLIELQKKHASFNFVIEPAFTIGFNSGHFRYQFQTGMSLPVSSRAVQPGFFGSFGIGYRFGN